MRLNEFIDFCSGAVSEEMLAMQVFDFLVNNKYVDTLHLLQHKNRPQPLKVIQSTDPGLDSSQFFKRYNPLQKQNDEYDSYRAGENRICFISTDSPDQPATFYVLAFENQPSEAITSLMPIWKSLSKSLRRHTIEGNIRTQYKYADLISQLLHDVHAILELFPEEKSEEVQVRWNYQEQVNKKVLRYVRDLELFKSEMMLGTFLNNALQLACPDYEKIKLETSRNDVPLNIDAELMAEALAEVVKNALAATENQADKIEIRTHCEEMHSPFVRQKWLKIIIRDYGKGIIPDFLPYVKKPFFTTNKFLGRPGFGLSIAEKILRAHNGRLEIQSIKGHHTEVIFLIPVDTPLCLSDG